jgi:hypothetical protein
MIYAKGLVYALFNDPKKGIFNTFAAHISKYRCISDIFWSCFKFKYAKPTHILAMLVRQGSLLASTNTDEKSDTTYPTTNHILTKRKWKQLP